MRRSTRARDVPPAMAAREQAHALQGNETLSANAVAIGGCSGAPADHGAARRSPLCREVRVSLRVALIAECSPRAPRLCAVAAHRARCRAMMVKAQRRVAQRMQGLESGNWCRNIFFQTTKQARLSRLKDTRRRLARTVTSTNAHRVSSARRLVVTVGPWTRHHREPTRRPLRRTRHQPSTRFKINTLIGATGRCPHKFEGAAGERIRKTQPRHA